ncbi:PP2C family protein-serine/threonine phosphatase [Chloroflexota bacterium]
MEERLLAIAKRFWPTLETASKLERTWAAFDLFGILYTVPVVLVGLTWLAAVTDLSLIRREWSTLLLLCALLFLFKRLRFFAFIEAPGDRSSQFDSTFEPIVTWSAALIFGPTALWIAVLVDTAIYGRRLKLAPTAIERGDTLRNLLDNLSGTTLASLIALTLYQRWGGSFPLPGLTLDAVLPAVGATLVHLLLVVLVFAPMLVYIGAGWSPVFARGSGWLSVLGWGMAIVMGAAVVVELFAILTAGLYTENGPGVYFTLLAGMLLVSWLAHRLSMSVERSQQRSRELAKLEQLGRAILNAPPDGSTLPNLLEEYVAGMFLRSRIEIRLYPEQTLLHHPENWPPVGAPVWEWLRANPEPRTFLPKALLPWAEQLEQNEGLALAPILDAESPSETPSEPAGGVYLLRRQDPLDVDSLLPALQSLAAQIASALHRAEVYRIEQELAVAGRIQASFLPGSLPQIPGWQLAATLEPARETSGDFYDVIPLPNGRWGLLVADVADKGTGAALYMALSRTLIRTYAVEYDTQPKRALRAASRRILADASADLFVTVFYGILDPLSDTLIYCNAGHNPPYLLSAQGDDTVQTLTRTGLPLGIRLVEAEGWEQRTVQLPPGSALVLYTDGVTEAQNPQGEFFTEGRLLELLQAQRGSTAQGIQDAVMGALYEFAGDAPHAQHDDITLMALVRGRQSR